MLGKKIKDMHNLKKPSETLLDMMTLLIFLWSQIYSITVINLVSLIAHLSNVRQKPKLKNRTAYCWKSPGGGEGRSHGLKTLDAFCFLETPSQSLCWCVCTASWVAYHKLMWSNLACLLNVCCLGTGLTSCMAKWRTGVQGRSTFRCSNGP